MTHLTVTTASLNYSVQLLIDINNCSFTCDGINPTPTPEQTVSSADTQKIQIFLQE